MQNATDGWVKSIHESRYGELLGLVMVGPHVTDLIEAGVVALDAESTVETVADGMTAHPTLSEAIKEAGLLALGRAIHLPESQAGAPRAHRLSGRGRIADEAEHTRGDHRHHHVPRSEAHAGAEVEDERGHHGNEEEEGGRSPRRSERSSACCSSGGRRRRAPAEL